MQPRALNVRVVDPLRGPTDEVRLTLLDGLIESIDPVRKSDLVEPGFLIPGFVDAHVHIESSMLLPSEFSRIAVTHGTVATVSDPHEIANVCGRDGIEYMLRNAEASTFKFYFGAPSCVPATTMETSGATLDTNAVASLLDDPRINHLCEVMNFPGVLSGNREVHEKINAAIERSLPIDGHAPGLRGADVRKYFGFGISSDHECVSLEEAEEKISAGAMLAIREGSAARNFDVLWPLIDRFPEQCMFCSDDKHPDDLLAGHINRLAARAVQNGADTMNVLRCACVNPVTHYQLDVGLLQVGDPADFILVHDLERFRVRATYVNGQLVAKDGRSLGKRVIPKGIVNQFSAKPISPDSIRVDAAGGRIRVIKVLDGQLITESNDVESPVMNGRVVSDANRDLLKLVVVNRYFDANPAVAFVHGFGLRSGAIASSVAHDSHNVVAVGVSDVDLLNAINCVIQMQGGLAVACGDQVNELPLQVGGLMATDSCQSVAAAYVALEKRAKALGSDLQAPFMSLSFLALPVIPQLKLTDQGLFDVNRFEFVSLFV